MSRCIRTDIGSRYVSQSLQHTIQDVAPIKAVTASGGAVIGLLVGAVDQVVIAVGVLWMLDMIAGTVHALDESDSWRDLDLGKARSGFLRGVIYLVAVAAAALGAGVLATVGGPDLVPAAIWFVCVWVAVAEGQSIVRHVDHFYPGAGKVLMVPFRALGSLVSSWVGHHSTDSEDSRGRADEG